MPSSNPNPTASPSHLPPTTLTPETLESDLLSHLASSTALEDIHSTLLSSLQRTGWTEKIRRLSLELLRAGRCDRFDEVVEAVVASAEGRGHGFWDGEGEYNHGQGQGQGESEDGGDGGAGGAAGDAAVRNMDVRIPSEVVEQGVRAIKEVLREVVVLEDDYDASASGAGVGAGEGSNGTEKEKEKDKEREKGKHGGATEKPSKGSSKSELKNGDTSPVKKTEKKPKPGKQK